MVHLTKSMLIGPQSNRDLNKVILHILSKFVDPSLNRWCCGQAKSRLNFNKFLSFNLTLKIRSITPPKQGVFAHLVQNLFSGKHSKFHCVISICIKQNTDKNVNECIILGGISIEQNVKSMYFREYVCRFSRKLHYFCILGVSHLNTENFHHDRTLE